MEEKVKVYVVGGDVAYASWIKNHELTNNLENADIVIFTGGEDVDPSIYGKKKHPKTYSNIERDKYELEIFNKIRSNQLVIGICRGSQFICAVNGGILIQDCSGHAITYTHSITNGKIEVQITSTHHQMQYPWTIDDDYFDILFYSSDLLSTNYYGEGVRRVPCEPEIVKYHVPNKPICLAIQGHPEYMRKESPIINILNELLLSCLSESKLKK